MGVKLYVNGIVAKIMNNRGTVNVKAGDMTVDGNYYSGQCTGIGAFLENDWDSDNQYVSGTGALNNLNGSFSETGSDLKITGGRTVKE